MNWVESFLKYDFLYLALFLRLTHLEGNFLNLNVLIVAYHFKAVFFVKCSFSNFGKGAKIQSFKIFGFASNFNVFFLWINCFETLRYYRHVFSGFLDELNEKEPKNAKFKNLNFHIFFYEFLHIFSKQILSSDDFYWKIITFSQTGN